MNTVTLNHYRALLETHDWHYEDSGHARDWLRGTARIAVICRHMDDSAEHRALYLEYRNRHREGSETVEYDDLMMLREQAV